MLKIIIGIILILVLVNFLSPQTREYLNEKVQTIFFREAKERAKERELIGSLDFYSPRVEEIQKTLKDAGFSPGPIDGRMGWQTRKAIREFQEAKGLRASGIVNQETWLELSREKVAQANRKEEKIEEPLIPLYEEEPKKVKSKEEILKIVGPQEKEIKEKLPKDRKKQIQIALQKAGFNPGSIDGKLGKKTRKAIREFQEAKGLKVDGVIGEKTWNELKKYLKER